ncbi:phage major capsid protein, P2 family [Laribacter hongkongensis]|uniref:P2 family phage major capsid protein n=1 Tax=Laribacter hongkongensis TaxID=168471 RepID=UPI001EFD5A71|nr:P2 family phage major capsid protein [Laribacter hongkongensis]MCG9065050.1 phage major capsid protein, P2 family [Laribacter hongkongensis]
MNNNTRTLLSEFTKTFFSSLGGVQNNSGGYYKASPNMKQAMQRERSMMSKSQLFQSAHLQPVFDANGFASGFEVATTLAGTVQTQSGHDRIPNANSFQPMKYVCRPTNFDAAIPYAMLDSWANWCQSQDQFNKLAINAIEKRIVLDRIMIGFNGTKWNAESDREINPRLQDVNIGWLQLLRDEAPWQCRTDSVIGPTGDFKSLDALIRDTINTTVASPFRDEPGLIAIIGADLLPDPLVNSAECELIPDIQVHKRLVGGVKGATAAFFPTDSIFITRISNLSLYTMPDAHRVFAYDNPSRSQFEFFNQFCDGYVIENPTACALIDKITIQN